ncbi:hypothetical protein GG344DRAFT_83937 [Lentinula edodes]|nr:hypothetical protein GG344DRAFT_83937 [Lentinula edodes]
MVDDGHIIMTPQAEVDFLARSFYQFLLYHQRRSGTTASGNFETFRHTYSIERDGQFYYPRPWPLAPDGAPLNKDLYAIGKQSKFESIAIDISDRAKFADASPKCTSAMGSTLPGSPGIYAIAKGVPGPRFTGIPSKQAEALRIKRKKVAAHRRKSSKSRKAVAAKIFTEDNDNYGSDVSESDEDADVEFSVKRFISHRVSMDPKHPGYEYLVEWEQDNTESWVHDSLIKYYTNLSMLNISTNKDILAKEKCTVVIAKRSLPKFWRTKSNIVVDMEVAANVDHFEYEGLESNDSSTINTLANKTYTSAFPIPLLLKISENSITSAIHILKDVLSSQHETEGISVLRMFQQVQEIHFAIENSPLDGNNEDRR